MAARTVHCDQTSRPRRCTHWLRSSAAVRGSAPCTRSTHARAKRTVHCKVIRADVNWDAFGWGPSSIVSSRAPDFIKPAPVLQFDFVVVGSGIAGLTYALKVAQYGRVAVVTKDRADEGCTRYAQGGVCAVLDAHDSVENHVRDTMAAGAWLNDIRAVRAVCQEGPARVLELAKMGAEFTRGKDGTFHLTKEGGHSNRRIVHAADATGAEIERALLSAARSNANIEFFEHHVGMDLVVDDVCGVPHCFGLDVLDMKTMQQKRVLGLTTMLASGGAGQVYQHTTNPHVATGDGIAMAFRAGALIANMEFVQFHPTSLYTPETTGRANLISEAVRGEGGLLYNLSGERFMPRYDPRAELAPRDTVARSIHHELLKRGEDYVLLDISHKPAREVLSHFPNIALCCAEFNINITKDPIPVVPAQHYLCGGIQTGLLGETNIQGLYASGEVACSGLHGANRLASNSLLEGLVFSHRAVDSSVAHAEHAARSCGSHLHYAAASAQFAGSAQLPPHLKSWVADRRRDVRQLMWENCGIVRSVRALSFAASQLAATAVEMQAVYQNCGPTVDLIELRNLVGVAQLIISSALLRKESRGGHYCLDYPQTAESLQSTVLSANSIVPQSVPAREIGFHSSKLPLADTTTHATRKLSKAPADRQLTVRSTVDD